MGFSSTQWDSSPSPAPQTKAEVKAAAAPNDNKSFGNLFQSYLQQKFPIAGSVVGQVFGQNGQDTMVPITAPSTFPATTDNSIISMNAQPKSSNGGSGLKTLLSLIA